MLISKSWLLQYLPEGIKISNDKLKERLSVSTAEVESIREIGENLKNIVVGEIEKITPHPKSPKLQIAIVNIGNKRKYSIICSATNISQGVKVPVALPGATVLNPKQSIGNQDIYKIKEIEILKVKSSGMLCSQKELGLSDSHEGIWILPPEAKIGEDFVKLISDTVLEIENKTLTNRSDCFNHLGIAREISAVVKTPFDYQETEELLIPTKTLPFVVKVNNKDLCKRYSAIVIQGIKIKPSPLWLQLKLLACGIRPINNVVDATNYVMLDIGQPLHAFDYNKLNTPRVIVRTAKPREKITTLDGKKRKLKKVHLLICDPSGPIGVAGIMGGLNSEIFEKTKDIIIESANFEMYNIRRTSRELGIRSEASTRFEKGLDPNLTLTALKKAVQLIIDIAGGEVASELIDFYPDPVKEKSLEIDISDVPRLLGIELSKDEIKDIFESLQLEVNSPETNTNKIKVTIPTFRRDLNIKEDLIEEIARIYGYDKFKPTLPQKKVSAVKTNQKRKLKKTIKQTLAGLGFDEVLTYSFTGERQYKNTLMNINDCIKIKNPISPKLNYMRSSIIPNILEKVQPNLDNFDEIGFYEISEIVLKNNIKDGLPKQPNMITGILSQPKSNEELFYILKGKITTLFKNINISQIIYQKEDDTKYLHPGQQAKIMHKNTILGHIGTIHPQVKKNWNIKQNTVIFDLYFEKIFKIVKRKKKTFKKYSVYPRVKRDISFWIDKDIEIGAVLNKLKSSECKYIKKIEISDIYTTKNKKDKKSITINIILQSKRSTLSEEQIKEEMKIIIYNIKKAGGTIRKRK